MRNIKISQNNTLSKGKAESKHVLLNKKLIVTIFIVLFIWISLFVGQPAKQINHSFCEKNRKNKLKTLIIEDSNNKQKHKTNQIKRTTLQQRNFFCWSSPGIRELPSYTPYNQN